MEQDCSDHREQYTVSDLNNIHDKLDYRSKLFAVGYLFNVFLTVVCGFMYNPYLGGFSLFAFLAYFCRLNMAVMGDNARDIKAILIKHDRQQLTTYNKSDKPDKHGTYI